MYPTIESTSAPTLKIPTTLKRLKRGTTPAGDGVASGKTNVTLSFKRKPSESAMSLPSTIPNSPFLSESRLPATI